MSLNYEYINELLKYEKPQNGLYIVSTPIGNLSDITIRSLKILSTVDLVLCEDTRISKKLFSKFGIKSKLKPFHKFNSKKTIPNLIEKLSKKNAIALISDSGTPVISDPGADLIRFCFAEKIPIFSLPGPTAPIASFVLSNFSSTSFSFQGFFPRLQKDLKKIIVYLRNTNCPTIFFESPKRILKTLDSIYKEFGDCKITFVRELTKRHEEVINSNVTNLIEILNKKEKILGEITFIVETQSDEPISTISSKDILTLSKKLTDDGMNIRDISRMLSKDLNISKREVYQLIIKNKK